MPTRYQCGPKLAKFCSVMLLLVAVSSLAEQHAFEVKDSISMTTFSEPSGLKNGDSAQLSPDGRYFWLVTSRGIVESNGIESTLWLFDAAGAWQFLHPQGVISERAPAPKRVARIVATPEIYPDDSYQPLITDVRWSSDSRTIFFLGQNSHVERQLYKVSVREGHLEALTPPGYGVRQFALAGSTIAYTAIKSKNSKVTTPWDVSSQINADAGAITGLGLEDILFPQEGHGYGNGKVVPDLWTIRHGQVRRVLPMGSERQVQDSEHYNDVLSLSPDGRFVVRLMPVTTVKQSWSLYQPIAGFESWRISPEDNSVTMPANYFRLREYQLVDTVTDKVAVLIDGPNGLSLAYEDRSQAVWSPDGRRLLLGNVALPFGGADPAERTRRTRPCAVAAVDMPSMQVNCIVFTRDAADVTTPNTSKPERLQDASFGSGPDEVILHLSWHKKWGQTERYRYNDGKWTLTDVSPGDTITGVVSTSAGLRKGAQVRLSLTIRQNLNDPPKLWATDTNSQETKLLWDPNPQLAAMRFGKASLYHWRDKSNHAWTGVLLTPLSYVAGDRYPLVIQTHGFSDSAFLTDGAYPTAMGARPLASAGFVVLQTGWSTDHFATNEEARDQVAGFEAAISQLSADGLVDPSRVGVTGFSRSCWHVVEALVERPKMFAAATIADGIDLGLVQYTLFGDGRPSLQKEFEKIVGSSPDGDGLNNWIQRSPGFQLDRVVTPLRIEAIGSSSVLMEWQLYASLKRQNRAVDMIYIPDGQHILQKPLDRMASQQGTVDWFRFWLQGYEASDPSKKEQYRRWRNLRRQ